jgi:hypothetical protein
MSFHFILFCVKIFHKLLIAMEKMDKDQNTMSLLDYYSVPIISILEIFSGETKNKFSQKPFC